MKKYSYLMLVALLLIAASSVYAANTNPGSTNTAGTGKVVTSVTPPPTSGNAVQNRNQIQTQNAGEATQLQVANEENESLGGKTGTGSSNRSEVAAKNMSEVAKYVQSLLETKTKGGIGDQVRQVAQEQNQAQIRAEQQLVKLENRNALKTALLGPDFQAMKNLQALITENEARIAQLQDLVTQLVNQADITAVKDTITALEQQNTALQDMVTAGEQTRSMFGWLIRLFVK